MKEDIIIEDTNHQEISKVVKEFKKSIQKMEDLMQKRELCLVQYTMVEFQILLKKMIMLNVK